ncbi:MAG: sigma-70 family polymerase sigma factor [Paenibacillus sp.]|jgi:RNA polymerase sigma-70 factor (ECF subfamily)|nr:sigma-70 family polymerase sigma factor [Paenibacillus sp.]
MHTATDTELMQHIRLRNRDAFEHLYDRYVKLVYSYAWKSVQNEQAAKEVVQLVFTRIWTSESGYDPDKGRFVNWLITVTRNMSIDYIRKQRKFESAVAIEPKQWAQIPDSNANSPEEKANNKWVREQIRSAFHLLSEHQIKLIERVYWQGYTLSEVAEMNNEPLGTIKSRLHQSLKVLRRYLILQEEER